VEGGDEGAVSGDGVPTRTHEKYDDNNNNNNNNNNDNHHHENNDGDSTDQYETNLIPRSTGNWKKLGELVITKRRP